MSNAAHVLGMSVVRDMRRVGGVWVMWSVGDACVFSSGGVGGEGG